MVQVRASGRKTFYFRERGDEGKTSQVKIADVEHIRLNVVRELKQRKAAQTQAALAAFANPYGEAPEAQPQGQVKEPAVSSPLLATFVREAYLPYIRTYKRSYSCDVSLLNNHVLPFFGDKQRVKTQSLPARARNDCPRRSAAQRNRLLVPCRLQFAATARFAPARN
jgi:hypothetical protein